MTVGPGWVEPKPDAYEAANGIEAATPGMVDNPGNRDPSSTTVDGSVATQLERLAWQEQDIIPQGGSPGDEVPLPDAYTPNEGI